MNAQVLRDAGLTEGEIKVYLALIELGSSTTGRITERAGVAKSIIYVLLERLVEKGLAAYVTKNRTKLLEYVERKEQQLHENKKQIEALLPQLMLRAANEKTEIRVYEGFEGMKTVQENILIHLRKGDDYFFMGITSEQPTYYKSYWSNFDKRRGKAGITSRLLFNKDNPRAYVNAFNSGINQEGRYMPADINTPSWFGGYGSITIIGFPAKDPITIEIRNPQIAASMRAYFETFWKLSKPLQR
jgi:predicted transcriptional regulator